MLQPFPAPENVKIRPVRPCVDLLANSVRSGTFPSGFMGRRHSPGRDLGAGYQHLALGLTFAAGVVFFTLAGVFLDRRLGATPLFTLIGTATGATLSFLNVYWRLKAEAEERRKKKPGEDR